MDKKIVLYIVLGILIVGLLALTFFPGMTYAISDSGNSEEDKCAVPEGYTEEAWYEYMSHHPNVYEECLS